MNQGVAIILLDLVKIIAFHATINTKLAMICTCKCWYYALNQNDQIWRDEISFFQKHVKASNSWPMYRIYCEVKQIARKMILLREDKRRKLDQSWCPNMDFPWSLRCALFWKEFPENTKIIPSAMGGGVKGSLLSTGENVGLLFDKRRCEFSWYKQTSLNRIAFLSLEEAMQYLDSLLRGKIGIF